VILTGREFDFPETVTTLHLDSIALTLAADAIGHAIRREMWEPGPMDSNGLPAPLAWPLIPGLRAALRLVFAADRQTNP